MSALWDFGLTRPTRSYQERPMAVDVATEHGPGY
jgi:hypothetical protein